MKVLFLSIFLFKEIFNNPVDPNNNDFLTKNNHSNNIKPGYHPYFPSKKGTPSLTSITYNLLMETKQINIGYSKYGSLPNKSQYECSGGLGECINSCCVNGICVQAAYQCAQTSDLIQLIYIFIFTLFTFLVSLFSVLYIMLGWNKFHQIKSKTDEKLKYIRQVGKSFTPHFPIIDEVITERIDESSNIGQTIFNTNRNNDQSKAEEIQFPNNIKCLSSVNNELHQKKQKSFLRKKTLEDKPNNHQMMFINSEGRVTEEIRKTSNI